MKRRTLIMFLCLTVFISLVTSGTNTAEGSPAYKGASSWAVPELDKAAGYGLITERIKDNMSANITREEFAEIAVRFYEVYTGRKAEPGNASFSDTSNPEILKAANLGLTSGIGGGKFGPNQLVTREQIATMLVRALKVVRPDADYSSAGSAKFTDDNLIEDWAREGVYYCAKSGIIKGIQNNDGTFRFDPDGNSSREVAVIVVTRAYEYFISEANKQAGDSGGGTQGNGARDDTAADEALWNGDIIIFDGDFTPEQYIIREVNGATFIYLPYDSFRYVFRMPYAWLNTYPEGQIKDDVITLEWKNKQGETFRQVIMQVGSTTAYVNGAPADIKAGPFVKEEEIYIPINLFIQLFEMKSQMFLGRWCFQYKEDFPQDILTGSWSSSQVNLFTHYKDIVSGVESMPSFYWYIALNKDGSYNLFIASSGGWLQDKMYFEKGKYKVIGNVIIYYDRYETLYEGKPLMLQYENRHMGDRLEFDFIEGYDAEEDKIKIRTSWYYRVND